MNRIIFTISLITILAFNIFSQTIPKQISYQGVLKDASGNILSGDFAMTFKIYNDPTGGSALWTEIQTVSVANGLFSVQLGSINPITTVPFDRMHFLGITVGTESELSPRTLLSPSPYSFMAMNALDNSITSAKILDGTIVNSDLSNNSVTSEKIMDGQVVRSINSKRDDIILTAQGGATITTSNDTIIINAGSGGGGTGVQGIQNTNNTLDIVNPNGPTVTVNVKDGSVGTTQLAPNSVTTAKIANGTISFADIGQNSATDGQVIKWSGGAWTASTDNVGSSSSGWTDDGTTIRLSTSADSVQIGSVSKLGKLNVGGDIGMNLLSSIYFGSDATRISGLTGGDLRFVAEDLSVLTTEDITFGHYGDETWIKFDNANKRVGIGTLTPADRLHVVQNVATEGLSAIKGVATSTTVSNNGVYGESMSPTGYGLYGKSPKYGVYGLATGNQGRGVVGEATNTASIGVQGIATNTSSTGVWGEGSNQGVYGFSSSATGKGIYGKVTSAEGYSGYFEGGKFYVKGNAEVRDTLFANVLEATKITNMPGLANSIVGSPETYHSLATSWAELNSVTVNVPAPGYVLLFASCELLSDHAYNDVTAVYLGISKTSDGNGIKQIAHWKVNILTGTDFISECISAQGTLQVTSAGSQTFYLMGYRKGGDNTDVVYRHQCNMTALYIPVAYGTVE